MTLNLRFVLLLGFLFALFLGGVALLTTTHNAETSRAIAAAQEERSRLLDEIVSLISYPLDQFTRDYSLWDEMAAFVENPTDEWARINIHASLDTFRLRAAWVVRPDGSLIHTSTRGESPPPALPLAPADFPRLSASAPFNHFFANIDGTPCEIRACPIQPSSDLQRTSPPLGWLVAASAWDPAHLETLGKLTGAATTLAPPGTPPTPHETGGGFQITRPLPTLQQTPLATLVLTYRPPALESAEAFNRDELLIFILQGSLLVAVAAICIHRWILSPVRAIIASLRTDDAAPVAALAPRNDEIGLIARLVRSHFADRLALQRSERALAHTLAERVRLGRDLHDNVIQSLFATGMGLAATKSLVRSSPEQVEEGLEQVRSCLNEIIRDVRTFIVGLEPDNLDSKTFPQAVTALADALRAIRTTQIDTDIDDLAEQSLTPDLRRHALQLLREALLQRIRHSGANRLQISLHGSQGHVILSLTDDGITAAPSDNTPAGLGLASLAERAALTGALCEISPLPIRGNRIRVRFPVTLSAHA
jgi:signal transduction histidine kinase